jgi:flotillin
MIEFMDIRDTAGSQVIQNMMAKEKSRIEKESRVTVADNIREAEMKEIEAKREIALTRTQAEQQVGIRQAEADKEVGIAKEKSNQEVQTEAKITTERLMEVKKVEEVKSAEIARDVAVVKAEQDKQVQVVQAEAEKESTTRIAEGNLSATLKQAEGIQAEGAAKAEAEKAMLLAPVNAQLTLAKEIGDNEGYQTYLISVRNIEATESVGKEMAGAIKAADVKIIANSGDVQSGIGNLADIFTPKGGTSIGGMLEGLVQTDQGKALLNGVLTRLNNEAETVATKAPKAPKAAK